MGWVHAGMLGALAALAIPIIVHLVYGRRAHRIDLGTLRFLMIALKENIRRRRLKRWILLALRMLCVALLAVLFARPYLAARESGGEDRLVILLLDRSASMGLKQEGRRLLDLAIDQARKVLAQCGVGTQVEAAWFDHAVHPIHVDPSGHLDGSLRDAQSALGETGPRGPYGGTDYGAAMAWARDVATQSRRRRKTLYLFTDLQRSGLERTAAAPMPEDLQVHVIDLGRTYPENVAVTSVTTPKPVIRPGEAASVQVKLLNTGPFAREAVPVVLRLTSGTKRQEFRSQAPLAAGGTASVRFELPPLVEGPWQGTAEVEVADDLPFDNRGYVALLVAPPLGVLLVDGDPGPSPSASETFFLETAIRLAEPGASFAASPFTTSRVEHSGAGTLPAWKGTSLVVLANVAGLSPGNTQRLADFVRQGGGLLVFTGENVQGDGCRALAEAGLAAGTIGSIARADTLPWRLETWDREHPLLRPFSDPQYGDLRRPAFRAITRIEPAADAKVLARFRGGEPALVEKKLGSGKVLWFATACDLDWGDWPRSRLYVPIVHQMLGYLAGLTEGGPVRNIPLESVAEGTEAVPGVFAREGFCEVVNLDPRESESERIAPEQFAARFHFDLSPGEDLPTGDRPARAAAIDQLRPNEIWHWVVLCLLAFLLLESFLGNRTTA